MQFRSTGSYEPDRIMSRSIMEPRGFDPQALTSLTLVALKRPRLRVRFRSTGSYEPDRVIGTKYGLTFQFRSTGSYEPDPMEEATALVLTMFRSTGSYEPDPFYTYCCKMGMSVSIHRLLRA